MGFGRARRRLVEERRERRGGTGLIA